MSEQSRIATGRRPRRRLLTAAAALVVVAVIALLLRSCQPEPVVTVVAAGDMACDPLDPAYGDGLGVGDSCRAQAVSDLAMRLRPDALLGLGDYQHELPTAEGYATAYARSWGRLREVTIPARGNQEYKVHEANTFTEYFGEYAGDPAGYWSTGLGAWHVVVLDSNCTTVFGGCGPGSVQQQWLAEDLADSGATCTVALMHHPRWSNGIAGDDQSVDALWRTLADHGVELVLAGHEADYERFDPMDADGRPADGGLTQIVSGVGGQAHSEPVEGEAARRDRATTRESAFVDYDHHGFVELTLGPDGWSSSFHALDAGVLDRASGDCS